ncbi:MAG: RecX family transcriptional regulator [Mobilitalea sp.]
MIITRFEELDKSKVRIYIDEEYAFLLYRKDIKRFKLEEGEPISQERYDEIMEDTIFRRAKQKAIAILVFMDRSEHELRKKLTETGYPSTIVERTITYVYEYGYINDERYAAAYIRTKMNTKSKMVIKNELSHKGISNDIIENAFYTEYDLKESEYGAEDAELNALKKAIAKKTKSPEELTPEMKQKLIASLFRKGFDIKKIKQALSESESLNDDM